MEEEFTEINSEYLRILNKDIMETQTKKIKVSGSHLSYIKEVLKENFGEEIVFRTSEDTLYLLNSTHLTNPIVIELLNKYKMYVIIDLFGQSD